MSDVAIHVENLGKKYLIGQRERYYALRDVLARALTAPLRLLGDGRRKTEDGSSGPLSSVSGQQLNNSKFAIRNSKSEALQSEASVNSQF